MSHNSQLEFEVKDMDLLIGVVDLIGGIVKVGEQTVQLFTRDQLQARAIVNLPGWRYPVVVTKDNKLVYDHWGSERDTMKYLYDMTNEYTLRVTEKTARRQHRRSRRIVDPAKPGWQFVEVLC